MLYSTFSDQGHTSKTVFESVAVFCVRCQLNSIAAVMHFVNNMTVKEEQNQKKDNV